MKIFVTGGTGLLGSKLMQLGRAKHEMIGTFLSNSLSIDGTRFLKLDITNSDEVKNVIIHAAPDAIIHTAAMTDVDFCEDAREEVWRVNVLGTKNVATAAKSINAKFVYISTDYIFDGKNGPYAENAPPNPISHYGLTKLEGEKITSEVSNSLIVRSTIMFGWNLTGKKNFVTWLIDQLLNGKTVKIVTDQYGTPTFADDLAEKILKLVELNKSGVYNIAGKDFVSRFVFANMIADSFGLNKALIKSITMKEFRQKAKRPLIAGLVCKKIENDLNVKVMSITEALAIMGKQKTGGILSG